MGIRSIKITFKKYIGKNKFHFLNSFKLDLHFTELLSKLFYYEVPLKKDALENTIFSL